MSQKKLTDIPAVEELANEDVMHVVDASDTSDDPAGSSRKTPLSNLKQFINAENDADIEALQSDVSDLTSTVAGHETTIESHTTELADHEERISAIEADESSEEDTFTAIGETLADHETRIGDLETSQSTQDDAISTHGDRLDTLETEETDHESRISDLETSDASQDTEITDLQTADLFNGARPITRAVTGLNGVTPGGTSLKDFIEKTFYPAVAPTISMSGGNIRELGSSNAVTINWSVTKGTNPITSITIAGNVITPTGNNQSGSIVVNITQNIDTVLSGSVTWQNKRYWGKVATNGAPSDATILALTGAGVGAGSELSTTRAKTYTGINGAGQYLIFAFPTSFGTPSFTVNGLPNTAFTKIRANSAFTNASGYTTNYDVWLSNTPQNSPLNIVIS